MHEMSQRGIFKIPVPDWLNDTLTFWGNKSANVCGTSEVMGDAKEEAEGREVLGGGDHDAEEATEAEEEVATGVGGV